MPLSVRHVARLLDVPESRVLAWIDHDGLPAAFVQDELVLHRTHVLDFALAHRLKVPPVLYSADAAHLPDLPAALAAGDVAVVTDRAGLVDAIAAHADAVDRPMLRAVLASRLERSFAVHEDGIAVPSATATITVAGPPRAVVVHVDGDVAVDGRPVRHAVALLTPTVREHQALLAALVYALVDDAFVVALRERSPLSSLAARAAAVLGDAAGVGVAAIVEAAK